MKNLFKEAHKMTREMVVKYGVDYKAQFGLCLAYLLKNKEANRMVELKGSEKQVKWAEEIRSEVANIISSIKNIKDDVVKELNETKGKKTGKDYTESYNKKIAKLESILKNDSAKFYIDNFKELTYIRKDINYLNSKYRELKDKNEDKPEFTMKEVEEYYEFNSKEFHNKMLDAFRDGLRNLEIMTCGRLINALKNK